jgi:maltose/moltooligosaccharide transporter
MKKPLLSLAQIINMSIGFLGIQFGFALQNGNASAILQNFGADVEHLSWFWLAAPLTGMIVQPIIGHFSDNTWTKLGRRRPFFLAGAILASTALLFMPNSAALASYFPPVMVGAAILMFMDASFNVSMEPFRALVADNLPDEQTTKGFSIQTMLIGVGAVVGSALPKIMVSWFGVSETAAKGQVADNVIYSFYVGALVFILAIIWTVVTTKEYSPSERKSLGYPEETKSKKKEGLEQIFKDFANMPKIMLQLGAVQFFSWIALFSMWVFMTPAIAHHIFGTEITDGSSLKYRQAGSWVGVMFSVYNFIAMVYAIALPSLAQKLGKRGTHAFNLICGAIGFISIYFAPNQDFLLYSMVGVGMAWASILAMPYAILAPHIPSHKMGIYMGIFNFFITFPQITIAVIGGPILKNYYGSNAIYAILMAGVFMFLAAISVIVIDEGKKNIKAA